MKTIFHGINQIIGSFFTASNGYTIYMDSMPENYNRPSFLITYGGFSAEDISAKLLHCTLTVNIQYYPTVEGYSVNKMNEKLDVQQGLCDLFAKNFLRVEDRAVKFKQQPLKDSSLTGLSLVFDYFNEKPAEETQETIKEVLINERTD